MGRVRTTRKGDALKARVAALVADGLDDSAIAERLGVHRSTVQRRRLELGVTLMPHNTLPEESVREIHRLHDEEEWPPGEIAIQVGVDPTTVHRHLGTTETGKQWNAVARWAARNHPRLWEELKR